MCGCSTELELGTVCHSTVIVGIPAAQPAPHSQFPDCVECLRSLGCDSFISAAPHPHGSVQKWKLAQFYDISPLQKLGGASTEQRSVARYCRPTISPAAGINMAEPDQAPPPTVYLTLAHECV